MDLKRKAESLSEIEAKALKALNAEQFLDVREISEKAQMPIDSVRRAVQWLKEKCLIELAEEKQEKLVLTQIGKSSFGNRLPERLFIEALQALGGKATLKGKGN